MQKKSKRKIDPLQFTATSIKNPNALSRKTRPPHQFDTRPRNHGRQVTAPSFSMATTVQFCVGQFHPLPRSKGNRPLARTYIYTYISMATVNFCPPLQLSKDLPFHSTVTVDRIPPSLARTTFELA